MKTKKTSASPKVSDRTGDVKQKILDQVADILDRSSPGDLKKILEGISWIGLPRLSWACELDDNSAADGDSDAELVSGMMRKEWQARAFVGVALCGIRVPLLDFFGGDRDVRELIEDIVSRDQKNRPWQDDLKIRVSSPGNLVTHMRR